MRRIIVPITAVLLASACSSGTTSNPPSGDHPPIAQTPNSSGQPRGLTGSVPTPSGRLVVAIPAGKLPYKPDAGMPALDDVKVIKTASDPCTIPSDDSGEEAQLLGAVAGGPGTVNVTFGFTNPCSKPVVFSYKVTAALGSATGEPAGGGAEGTTKKIEPRQTVKEVVPVDVSEDLTAAQQKRLWVGCTEIGKQDPGY